MQYTNFGPFNFSYTVIKNVIYNCYMFVLLCHTVIMFFFSKPQGQVFQKKRENINLSTFQGFSTKQREGAV